MSKNRQDPILRPTGKAPSRAEPITGVAHSFPGGEVVDWHYHGHAQLLYAIEGLMQIETPAGVWTVPPERAVYVPTGVAHQVTHKGAVEWRSLNLLEGLDGLPETCQVLEVRPLLRELIIEAHREWRGPQRAERLKHLTAVLLDQLRDMERQALGLPLPGEKRLRRITEVLLADPADPRALNDFAAESAASARTLARLFERETGMSFGKWRRQLRLQQALARLAQGESVTSVAYAVGYDSPSAFIAMFRQAMGQSPGKYLRTAAVGEGGSLAAERDAV